jgi:alpha-D-xyloside xylohydrolase
MDRTIPGRRTPLTVTHLCETTSLRTAGTPCSADWQSAAGWQPACLSRARRFEKADCQSAAGCHPALHGFTITFSVLLLASCAYQRASSNSTSPGTELKFTIPLTRGATDDLILDRFLFDGSTVGANTLHVNTLSTGVHEITSEAASIGQWEFAIKDLSNYYGFGERFDRLDHVHSILKNETRNTVGVKGNDTYKPVPFFMSLRGYGVWVDTYSDAVFDLNVTDATHIRIGVRGKKLRVLLFEGPGFPAILDRFTALAGRQQLPPYWAFAPWKARDFHRNETEVNEDVDRYRKLGLPASVILIDSPWATNYNTYQFNPKQFADAPKMVRHLHDEGYKLVLWHTSWINQETATPGEDGFKEKLPTTAAANFSEADKSGYFLQRPDGGTYIGQWWKGRGGLIDFTNPAAKKWWQGQVAKAIDAGADGFKDDDAEGNFIGDVKFTSGEDVRMVRNRYAVDYNHAVAEILTEKKGKDWVLFQRSGTTGSHMLPFFWGGDNDASFSATNGLPTVVTAGLNAGMSGISMWMSDLGGYNKIARRDPDPVLFSRWTEYSALSPGMEMMTSYNWGPWDYGDEALQTFRMYSILHMSLFPYRYAAAQESARNGLPLMRSLLLMHQDDPDARAAETEYYFGPDLLVAPVLSPVTQRSVYLPEGDWVDYWSGKQFTGKQTMAVDAPLDRLPLYVRSGAIIPKIPEDVMTLVPADQYGDKNVKSMDNRRVYEIYPGAKLEAIQDFEGRQIQPGDTPGSLTISGAPARMIIRWRFGAPHSAVVNGKSVAITGSVIEFDHTSTTTLSWK